MVTIGVKHMKSKTLQSNEKYKYPKKAVKISSFPVA